MAATHDIPKEALNKLRGECVEEVKALNGTHVEVASKSFIDAMHRDANLIWANAIIYNYKDQLTAGHSDDVAVCLDPDMGWG